MAEVSAYWGVVPKRAVFQGLLALAMAAEAS